MSEGIRNANLGLRFLLELAALAALVTWGLGAASGLPARIALGIGLPLAVAAIWGVFRVPGDPGNAPVPVPGPVRLLIELAVWAGATAALVASGQAGFGVTFAALVLLSNALMPRRLARLLRNG